MLTGLEKVTELKIPAIYYWRVRARDGCSEGTSYEMGNPSRLQISACTIYLDGTTEILQFPLATSAAPLCWREEDLSRKGGPDFLKVYDEDNGVYRYFYPNGGSNDNSFFYYTFTEYAGGAHYGMMIEMTGEDNVGWGMTFFEGAVVEVHWNLYSCPNCGQNVGTESWDDTESVGCPYCWQNYGEVYICDLIGQEPVYAWNCPQCGNDYQAGEYDDTCPYCGFWQCDRMQCLGNCD